jgi:hypothetical protein
MTERRPKTGFWWGLIGGALGGFAVGRRLAALRQDAVPRLGEEEALQQKLAEKHGDPKAADLMARIRARYADLYITRPRHANRASREHLEGNILQGLAIYQVLREENDDQAAVLAEINDLFEVYAQKQRAMMVRLGQMPGYFHMLRKLTPWIMRWLFPSPGWTVEWVENSEQAVAFNITRCFYLDTLTAYGAPELTAAYCRLDDLIYQDASPFVKWERTKTLGRSDEFCDFCWRQNRSA